MNTKNMSQKVTVQVYEHLAVDLTINADRTGYTFKTPKGLGGRHYYSFCNHIAQSFEEQFPELEIELRINARNN